MTSSDPEIALAVDVNGRFDLKQALAYAEALEPYDLFWYEEPGDPLDYLLNAALAGSTSLPLADGREPVLDYRRTNLIRYGGMRPDKDFLQMDPALSYGLVEYLRTLDMLRDYGWVPPALHPARRSSIRLAYRRRSGALRQRIISACFSAFWRLRRRYRPAERAHSAATGTRNRL